MTGPSVAGVEGASGEGSPGVERERLEAAELRQRAEPAHAAPAAPGEEAAIWPRLRPWSWRTVIARAAATGLGGLVGANLIAVAIAAFAASQHDIWHGEASSFLDHFVRQWLGWSMLAAIAAAAAALSSALADALGVRSWRLRSLLASAVALGCFIVWVLAVLGPSGWSLAALLAVVLGLPAAAAGLVTVGVAALVLRRPWVGGLIALILGGALLACWVAAGFPVSPEQLALTDPGRGP